MADELNTGRLATIDELDDFEIADGDPDPRGWKVLASDGREIGEIEQLIIDTSAMKVRYLDCDLDDGVDMDEDRHILIPVGYARLDEDDRNVYVDSVASADVTTLPAYTGLPLASDTEERLHAGFRGELTDEVIDRDVETDVVGGEATVTRSEEELAVGKREMKAGEVDVEKHVETEHVSEPVTTHHEEVEIERRPASGMTAKDARIEDEEVHIPLEEEEVVVEKRPEVKEELVVKKRDVAETETVEADLRKEEVEIEEHGNVEEEDGRML